MSTKTLNIVRRVLPVDAYKTLRDYERAGGGRGLHAARAVDAEVVLAELEASGLRGRGGAGFPTGAKWRTILSFESGVLRTPVVVNAAEGEPGTYKDRAIMLANPYAVLEGALIAAVVMGANSITVATKQRFADQARRMRDAIEEVRGAGWANDIDITVVEGPVEYLFGEETALLEVLDGRPPLPRIAPPWRRGLVEVVTDEEAAESGSGLAAEVEMATPTGETDAPPVLVNNVETMANIPAIVAKGAAWFRAVGTQRSPGTVVCTVTGAVRPTVVEVPLGTPLGDVIAYARDEANDAEPAGVLMGVSNAIVLRDDFDVPISHEALAARGSGLGSASFIVFDRSIDPVALAAGASRFLAVESCGQCTACKLDGLDISDLLARIGRNEVDHTALDAVDERLARVTEGARCNLAAQQQAVIGSILDHFRPVFAAHLSASVPPVEPLLVAEVLRVADGVAELDPTFVSKQPDWTYEDTDSGQTPAARLTDHRAG